MRIRFQQMRKQLFIFQLGCHRVSANDRRESQWIELTVRQQIIFLAFRLGEQRVLVRVVDLAFWANANTEHAMQLEIQLDGAALLTFGVL